MTKKLFFTILLAIFMSASMTFAQTKKSALGDRRFDPPSSLTSFEQANKLADDAVKKLLAVEFEQSEGVPPSSPILGNGRDEERAIQRRVRMVAGDIIQNFAGRIYKHYPSQQDVCGMANVLDWAVQRHIETRVGIGASAERKVYEAEELVRTQAGIAVLYQKIGFCNSFAVWIDKPPRQTSKTKK